MGVVRLTSVAICKHGFEYGLIISIGLLAIIPIYTGFDELVVEKEIELEHTEPYRDSIDITDDSSFIYFKSDVPFKISKNDCSISMLNESNEIFHTFSYTILINKNGSWENTGFNMDGCELQIGINQTKNSVWVQLNKRMIGMDMMIVIERPLLETFVEYDVKVSYIAPINEPAIRLVETTSGVLV